MTNNSCGFGTPNTKNISNADYNAIIVASAQTGANVAILFAMADLLSSFNETLISTNGNTGLFQFSQTIWNAMLVQYGYIYKIPNIPSSITNPLYNALIGAQTILDIIILYQIKYSVNSPTAGQIYLVFLLGIANGPQLYLASVNTPSALASTLFPAAAANNKTAFFNSDGSSKTVLQVYNYLTNLANTKAIAYSGQNGSLLPPCMRGNGVSGSQTSIPNTPSGKINFNNPIGSAQALITGGWINGGTKSLDSVALVQTINNLPATSSWVQGVGNLVINPPTIGTAVATFNLDGTYGNISDISHSGIYLGVASNGNGIKLLDQWGISLNNPTGLPAAIRDVLNDPSKGFAGNANNYYIINILT